MGKLFRKKTDAVTVDDRLRHIAFIMDGNGRWAKKRGMPREYGHSKGAEAFDRLVHSCFRLGITHVTVYAFSTENWKRPEKEVKEILRLLDRYIASAEEDEKENRTRIIFIGDKNGLDAQICEKMVYLERLTEKYTNILNIAFNYGGRAEIVRAANALIAEGKTTLTEADFSAHMYTVLSPDPDLIVRTAGECRLSNFLLWQCAYAEFYYTETLWPDFDEEELKKAIRAFYARKRNFGGLPASGGTV